MNARDSIRELESLRGQNEMELQDYQAQLIAVDKALIACQGKLRAGGLTAIEETLALREIERYEKRRAVLENLVTIYSNNVNVQLDLLAHLQRVEAMRLRSVNEDDIDRIVEQVEESLHACSRVALAVDAGPKASLSMIGEGERRRLEDVRRRALAGESPQRARPGSMPARELSNE